MVAAIIIVNTVHRHGQNYAKFAFSFIAATFAALFTSRFVYLTMNRNTINTSLNAIVTSARVLLTALLFMQFAHQASAHHSAAQYDFSQMVEVIGKVIHVDIANPHIDLILEIENADGSTKEVQFEGHARNNVYRRGWRPDAFAEGDVITIHIAPMRDGTDGGYIQQFTMADGQTF